MRSFFFRAVLASAGLLLAGTAMARSEYQVDYTVRFLPDQGQAEVVLAYTPGNGKLVKLDLLMPTADYPRVWGDGSVVRKSGSVVWTPPANKAATLNWRVAINQQRTSGGYDARITKDWAIVRGDDLVPAATARASKGADARVRLAFALPTGWSNVDTPYLLSRDGKQFVVTNPERRFDRPVGWIIAGQVGTRREWLHDTEISVAGPKGGDVRRNDMLAFFNRLVPELRNLYGELPPKLLIVSAGDPMWRGGLSGPRSLFIHADRPLISENGTSTLVHELSHVITRIRGADDDDWIAEGLAEYYSIELLHRAGLVSESRYVKAFEWMRRHGRNIKRLSTDRSSGRRTARAVTFFRELDQTLHAKSQQRYTLDHVVRDLLSIREVSREDLRRAVEKRIGPCTLFDQPLLQ